MTTQERIPTTQRLADALREVSAPEALIRAAESGAYDDFKSGIADNIANLIQDCLIADLDALAQRAMDGEFDSPDWEAEEWINATPEGHAIRQHFFGGDLLRQAPKE